MFFFIDCSHVMDEYLFIAHKTLKNLLALRLYLHIFSLFEFTRQYSLFQRSQSSYKQRNAIDNIAPVFQ